MLLPNLSSIRSQPDYDYRNGHMEMVILEWNWALEMMNKDDMMEEEVFQRVALLQISENPMLMLEAHPINYSPAKEL